jgi:predicted ATPase
MSPLLTELRMRTFQRKALICWVVCTCAGQFALMSFADLCGKPVAAADYIALTKV